MRILYLFFFYVLRLEIKIGDKVVIIPLMVKIKPIDSTTPKCFDSMKVMPKS